MSSYLIHFLHWFCKKIQKSRETLFLGSLGSLGTLFALKMEFLDEIGEKCIKYHSIFLVRQKLWTKIFGPMGPP